MNKGFLAGLGAAFAVVALCGAAIAENATLDFGADVATVVVPEGYVLAKQEGGVAELIPPDQTIDNWRDLFSIISADASSGPLEKLRTDLQTSFVTSCDTKTVVVQAGFSDKTGYRTTMWVQYCEKLKGSGLPETDILRVIESKGGYLITMRGFRSKISDKLRDSWAEFLRRTSMLPKLK